MTENPVDYLVRKTGLSRARMTKRYLLGENLLLLLSQGRKESVPDKVVVALQSEATAKGLDYSGLLYQGYGTADLETAYQEWIKSARHETELVLRIPKDLQSSPWGAIVQQIGSVSATSRVLKVRFILVRKYLTSPVMPGPIREALEDIGWTGIDRLDKAQRKYFGQ